MIAIWTKWNMSHLVDVWGIIIYQYAIEISTGNSNVKYPIVWHYFNCNVPIIVMSLNYF